LTPLLLSPPVHGDLAGLSLDVEVEAKWGDERRTTRGGFLFTHRGYSGPTILDISDIPVRSAMGSGERADVSVRWVEGDEDGWRSRIINGGSETLLSVLRPLLPL